MGPGVGAVPLSTSQSAAPTAPGARFMLVAGVIVVLVIAELTIGPVRVPVSALLDVLLGREVERPAWTTIVWTLRLPRVLTAAAAGAALGAAGLQMQTLFRNPLADPWFLGIVGGARVGVSILLVTIALVGMQTISPIPGVRNIGLAAAAIGGAVAALVLLSALARRVGIVTLLILGLVLDYMASGFVSAILHFSTELQGEMYDAWNDGSFGGCTWDQLAILAAFTVIGLLVATTLLKRLNALLLGERAADALGVPLSATRRLTLFSTALLAGSVTAFCGPISFIGVATPHICRAVFRTSDHRVLLPAVILVGSAIALLADFVTNLPWERHFLHLNAVNALVGGPVVLWVVLRRKGTVE